MKKSPEKQAKKRVNSILSIISSSQSRIECISLAVILIGVFLASYQFFYNRSLWHDEAALARNLVDLDLLSLLKPLKHEQAAPIGFLIIEKLALGLLGKNEYALRLFPLLSFFVSIPLFYLFLTRLLVDRTVASISTAIFSINRNLLDYSSEVKQYSMDVAWTLMIGYLSVSLEWRTKSALWTYAAVGSLAVWFSNVSIIPLATSGLYVIYTEAYRRRNYRVLVPILTWLVSFGIYYAAFIRDHPLKDYMIQYWQGSFLPLSFFTAEPFVFLAKATSQLYRLLGFGPLWPVSFAISLAALAFWVKHRKYSYLYICLFPVGAHLILSGLKLYPFAGRFLLYVAPLTIFMFASGLCVLFEFVKKKIAWLPRLAMIIPVLALFYPIVLKFPIEKQEIKQSLDFIHENIRSDDSVYVYYGASHAFAFYEKTSRIGDIAKHPIIHGRWHGLENTPYDRELSDLRGRVWLLFSHVIRPASGDSHERYMVDFLLRDGAELLAEQKFTGSSVYYLDVK